MNAVIEYLSQNWSLILILVAFAIVLKITVFLDRKTTIRMYILIVSIFLLSIIVYLEFFFADLNEYQDARAVMMAIRYSAVPIIIALIMLALFKRGHWAVLLPAAALTIVNVVSIFTGIVFKINASNELVRGPLGYLPYIAVGLYSLALIGVLIWQSNKRATDIIPIIFLAFALSSGLIFPFIIKKEYSKIFCSTIAIALFVYYVFSILQLTKKDPLTGLLNRQAYYAMSSKSRDITALLSIDMNGLKVINDNGGHASGDEALKCVATCLTRAAKINQLAFRVGGDEFVIICYRTSEEELKKLVERIEKNVSETQYSCSIGYSHKNGGAKSIDAMLKESDEMMYAAKAKHYENSSVS